MPEIISYDELAAQASALRKQVKYMSDANEKLTAEVKELKAQNEWYIQQLKLSKKKLFGASSETISADYGQVSFFNEGRTRENCVAC